MANITEVSQWENVIRQIENGEAATGGADGLANVQAKQLANRTKWLKENYLPLTGGKMSGQISRNVNDSGMLIYGGTEYGKGAELALYGNDRIVNSADTLAQISAGGVRLTAIKEGVGSTRLALKPNGELTLFKNDSDISDLAGAAIVAKSLGSNGYVKYASGLIIQWGNILANSETTGIVTFPLAFKHYGVTYCTCDNPNGETTTCRVIASNNTQFKFERGVTHIGLRWAAIGY